MNSLYDLDEAIKRLDGKIDEISDTMNTPGWEHFERSSQESLNMWRETLEKDIASADHCGIARAQQAIAILRQFLGLKELFRAKIKTVRSSREKLGSNS